MAYNETILSYAKKRDRYGELPDNKDVGIGYVGNAACGDMLKIYLKIAENDVIEDIKVKTYGCGCAIAATTLAAEKLIGQTLAQALLLTNKELADELALPGIKKHCSVLAEAAVKNAVENYQKKQKDNWKEIEVSKSIFEDVSKGCCKEQSSIIEDDIKKAKDFKNAEIYESRGFMSDFSKMNSVSEKCCNDITSSVSEKCCNDITSSVSEKLCNEKIVNKQTDAQNKSTQMPFTITSKAYQRFIEIMQIYPQSIGVLIGATSGGCAGNAYELDVVEQEPDNCNKYVFNGKQMNEQNNQSENLTIFVPKKALMFVLGVRVDYEDTEVQAGFKFTHPALKSCGCGESFRT